MMTYRTYAAAAVLAFSGLTLASCKTGGALEQLRAIDPATSPSSYYLALSRHYLHYAESLRHRNNEPGSNMMAKRGLDALRMPPPALPPEKNISTEQQQARAFVAYVTRDPGLQKRIPDEVAQLRWLYDCWEYESSILFGVNLTAECRSAYYALADTVFSAFAPKHIKDGAKAPQKQPLQENVKIHPLLKSTTPASAPKKAAPAVQPKRDAPAVIAPVEPPPPPPPPSPEELAERAEKMNPFLSVAERNAILNAAPPVNGAPKVISKPAVRPAVKRKKAPIIIAPKQQKKAPEPSAILQKRLHVTAFNAADAALSADDAAYAAQLGKALAAAQGGAYRVVINGFSDSVSGDAANMQLSLQRALAVKNALVKAGASESAVDAFAYGDKWTPESAGGDGSASYSVAEIIIKKQ